MTNSTLTAEVLETIRRDQATKWDSGRRVMVEEILALHNDLTSDVESVLDLIYNEILLRRQNHETPTKDEYVKRFPRFADDIETMFFIDDLIPADGNADSELPKIPGYEVIRLIGRGGNGLVYEARHFGLGRTVALKLINAPDFGDSEEEKRFRLEAETAAKLSHPNIVQIYDIGRVGGQSFLALEYIDGGSLHDKLHDRETGQPLPPKESAQLLETVSRAIHIAHQHNVIHRDVKPANILLTRDGTAKLTDFGLAKRLDTDVSQTQHTAVIGTAPYMAVEQITDSRSVDARTDVYQLGATLYEMLTGQPPFRAPTALQTLELVKNNEPVAPSKLQPGLPKDLEVICLRCLEKEPANRFANAEDLADDLRRFLNDEPIVSTPVSRTARVWKWCRRNRRVATLGFALILSLVFGTIASTSFGIAKTKANRSLTKANSDLGEAKSEAEKNADEAKRHAEEAMKLADDAFDKSVRLNVGFGTRDVLQGDTLAGIIWFAEAFRLHHDSKSFEPTQELVHRTRIGAFQNLSPKLQHTLFTDGPVQQLDITDDGKRVVLTVGTKGYVQVFDTESGNPITLRLKPPPFVHTARFCAGGNRLLTVAGELPTSIIQLWDVETSKKVGLPVSFPGVSLNLEFSRDGKRFVTASSITGMLGSSGEVRIWDSETLKPIGKVIKHSQWFTHAVLNQVGTRVATASIDGSARVWNLETGDAITPECMISNLRYPLGFVTFSPDGKSIAAASSSGAAQIWHAETGEDVTPPLQHALVLSPPVGPQGRNLAQVDFSPDGKKLLTICGDKTARVWDANSGRSLSPVLAHDDDISCGWFSPDGSRVLTAGLDGTVRIWNAVFGGLALAPLKHAEPIYSARFSKDGQYVISASRDTTARVWQIEPPRETIPQQDDPEQRAIGISSDGRFVMVTNGKEVRLWAAATRAPIGDALELSFVADKVAFAAHGNVTRMILATDQTKSGKAAILELRDETLQQLEPVIDFSDEIHDVTLSADGKLAALAGLKSGFLSSNGEARVWSIEERRWVTPVLPHQFAIEHVRFSPDGKQVLTAGLDFMARLWDTESGVLIHQFSHELLPVQTAEFSPDGKQIVTASQDDTAQVWNADTGKKIGSPLAHKGSVTGAVFDLAGTRVLTWSEDGTAKIWKWNEQRTDWQLVATPLQHERAIQLACFSADGVFVATAASDNTAQVWDSETGAIVSPPLEHLGTSVDRIVFSADGNRLYTRNLFKMWTWNIAAVKGDPDKLLRFAEWTAAQRVDETGRYLPIDLGVDVEYLDVLIEQSEANGNAIQWPLYYKRSQYYAGQGDGIRMAADCQRAIDSGADDSELLKQLGDALVKLKQYRAAADAFSRALKQDSTDAAIYPLLGNAYLRIGEFQKAAESFDEYGKKMPAMGFPLVMRGFSYASLGEWQRAATDYDEGMRRGFMGAGDFDVPVGTRTQRALIYLAMNDYTGYENACSNLLAKYGKAKDTESVHTVAWTCALTPKAIDLDKAQQLAEQALEDKPDAAEHLDTMGLVLLRQGNYSLALQRLNESIAAYERTAKAGEKPSYPVTYAELLLALCHQKLGNKHEARRWYDQAVATLDKAEQQPSGDTDQVAPWNRRLILGLFRDEAATALKIGNTPRPATRD
jgi:WD40 repeat protein/serine/threonine protein kinase/Flp pilus assembly protein TadD